MATPLHDDTEDMVMTASRMEAFSDGVIAIIVTIMVLELRPPAEFTEKALLVDWPVFSAYALSFTLVSIYWVNNHHLLHAARHIATDTLWLNIHWLFWLSLFPFATAYIGAAHGAPFPTAVYATLSLLVAFAYLLLARNLSRRNGHVRAMATLARKRQTKNLVAMTAMAAAIPLAWVWEPLAIALLVAPAVAYFLPKSTTK